MMKDFSDFKGFAFHRHDVYVNQKYGDGDSLPYSFHLDMVERQFNRFKHLLNDDDKRLARWGCWGHDLIEDGRMSYNDVKQMWGVDIADVIWGCSDSEGRNRTERHDEAYWARLTGNRISVFVKLCDRMANMLYSLLNGSSMFDKYKREWPEMRSWMGGYYIEFKEMFDFIEKIQNL